MRWVSSVLGVTQFASVVALGDVIFTQLRPQSSPLSSRHVTVALEMGRGREEEKMKETNG